MFSFFRFFFPDFDPTASWPDVSDRDDSGGVGGLLKVIMEDNGSGKKAKKWRRKLQGASSVIQYNGARTIKEQIKDYKSLKSLNSSNIKRGIIWHRLWTPTKVSPWKSFAISINIQNIRDTIARRFSNSLQPSFFSYTVYHSNPNPLAWKWNLCFRYS